MMTGQQTQIGDLINRSRRRSDGIVWDVRCRLPGRGLCYAHRELGWVLGDSNEALTTDYGTREEAEEAAAIANLLEAGR